MNTNFSIVTFALLLAAASLVLTCTFPQSFAGRGTTTTDTITFTGTPTRTPTYTFVEEYR